MKTKSIKVTYSTHNSKSAVMPKIQMEGKWLEDLGFSVGTRVIVEYEKSSIRIRPLTEEEIADMQEKKLTAELKRKQREVKALQHSIAEKKSLHVAESSGRYSNTASAS